MAISKNTSNRTRRPVRAPRDIRVSTKSGARARLFSSTEAAYNYARSLFRNGRGWQMELIPA